MLWAECSSPVPHHSPLGELCCFGNGNSQQLECELGAVSIWKNVMCSFECSLPVRSEKIWSTIVNTTAVLCGRQKGFWTTRLYSDTSKIFVLYFKHTFPLKSINGEVRKGCCKFLWNYEFLCVESGLSFSLIVGFCKIATDRQNTLLKGAWKAVVI